MSAADGDAAAEDSGLHLLSLATSVKPLLHCDQSRIRCSEKHLGPNGFTLTNISLENSKGSY